MLTSDQSESVTLAPRQLDYVLITPARNEARYIESTIKSMVAQTVKPMKWVIVSDGSTDGTDEIVLAYAQDHPWIQLARTPERSERHFAGKVFAFNVGRGLASQVHFDIIGNLDADVSFEPDYMAYLLDQFAADPRLGVAGTPYVEEKSASAHRFSNLNDVPGACQLFRRECFEEMGGYQPMKGGGIDHVAFLTARMNGWNTKAFSERVLLHHRPNGTALKGGAASRYRIGVLDYALGTHPLWEAFRILYQIAARRPYGIGGCFMLAGYLSACVRRKERQISPALVEFRRREQMQRLRSVVGRALNPRFTRKALANESGK